MNCNCNNIPQDCQSDNCDNFVPMFDIQADPEYPTILKFNYCGQTKAYDFGNMIQRAETDTTLKADGRKRELKYDAERHVDSISAKELGSILHIADIADVNISGVTDNSLFVYKKNNDCAHGCEGIDNKWTAWNPDDNGATSVNSVMGFDKDGAPKSVLPPANTNQFYSLGWNSKDKVGYHQPQERSLKSIAIEEGGKHYAYQLYVDPATKEIVYVKVEVEV